MDERLKIPDIPEEEKTPIVLLLLEIIKNQNAIIQELKDEVARLKGNPGRPNLRPSTTSQLDKMANQNRSENSKKKGKKAEAGDSYS
jgi:hypothetical protein